MELLDYPMHCPHGNVIPGLTELGLPPEAKERATEAESERVMAMTEVATGRDEPFVVQRISEQVQSDAGLMLRLKRIGIQPGREVTLAASHDGVRVTCGDYSEGRSTELSRDIATHVFVTRR
jgi:DtxR family transcriptional regulator, Mn-dependent transcriptional regulator